MHLQWMAFRAVLVAGLAALPFSAATAQYYYPPCHPFPLFWPVCAAAAVVGTAGAIVTAPFRPYYYRPPPPGYYPPPPRYYAPPPYYYGPR
jgi:hypothetical protein